MKKIILLSFSSTLIFVACKKEKTEETPLTPTPAPVAVKYAADVQPIFTANCGTGSSCHGTSGAANGKVYETHTGASAVAGTTTMGAIKHEAGFNNMPKNGSKLSSASIAKVQAWVDGGMKND